MSAPDGITAEEAVDVLNRIHHADPTVLPELIGFRVACNDAVRDDPTVQVGPVTADGHKLLTHEETADHYAVGFLGILNGIFGIKPDGRGYIGADFSEPDAGGRRWLRGFTVDRS